MGGFDGCRRDGHRRGRPRFDSCVLAARLVEARLLAVWRLGGGAVVDCWCLGGGIAAVVWSKPGLPLDEAHQDLGTEACLLHENRERILAGGANAWVPFAETAYILHCGLCSSVHLALLLRVGWQQQNENDQPKDGSNEKHLSAPIQRG